MRSIVAAAIGLLALGACAPIPVGSTYPWSTQQKMQAAQHWRVLADDMMVAMRGSVPTTQPLYLIQKGGGSFERGFNMYLGTALASQGYALSPTPQGANVLDYSVVPVVHRARRLTLPYPGFIMWFPDLLTGSSPGFDSNAEIIVTVVVRGGTETLFRRTATYYVPDRDVGQYAQVALTGAYGPTMPTPVRLSP